MLSPENITASTDLVREMEAIVTEHETDLLRYAARLVNDPTAAQDVVQNVFIKLFQNWKKGTRPTSALRAWLYRVTHNEAVDMIRRESRLRGLHERQSAQVLEECPDGVHCPDPVKDKKDLVLHNLRRLPAAEQQVILLRMEKGLSYTEISKVIGRTEGYVGFLLHQAVKKLAVLMKSQAHQEVCI